MLCFVSQSFLLSGRTNIMSSTLYLPQYVASAYLDELTGIQKIL
ncbi:unnamed protein product [Larinioides sclopetarius]|uniref:Uncharacterized protein n=1 Tax=Larinioides sclopetarius TaxID=280406 RepID=A0AAV2B444_9ARAC